MQSHQQFRLRGPEVEDKSAGHQGDKLNGLTSLPLSEAQVN